MPQEKEWINDFNNVFVREGQLYGNHLELKDFISSLLSSQAYALKEQLKAKLTAIAKPYDKSKWHNTLTLKQVLSAIESIEI